MQSTVAENDKKPKKKSDIKSKQHIIITIGLGLGLGKGRDVIIYCSVTFGRFPEI